MDEDKFIKTIGKWLLCLAGGILCIHLLCRFTDAEKSKEYEFTYYEDGEKFECEKPIKEEIEKRIFSR